MSSGILCRSVPLFWQEMGLWKLQSVLRGGSLLNPPYFSPSWLYAQVDCNNVGESISGSFRIGTLTEVLAGEALGDLFALASAAKGWRFLRVVMIIGVPFVTVVLLTGDLVSGSVLHNT